MECLTGQQRKTVIDKLSVFGKSGPFQYFIAAIDVVVKQRVPYVFHVDTNLVCTARFKDARDQIDIPQPFDNAVVGHRRFATLPVRKNGKHLPVFQATANVPFNGALLFGQIAPYQCTILPFSGFVEKLQGKVQFGLLGFGYQQ